MGYFIEQGEYELLFAEYNSIEEKAENMIDAYMNATSVNRNNLHFFQQDTGSCGTAEPYGERLVMLKRSSGQR